MIDEKPDDAYFMPMFPGFLPVNWPQRYLAMFQDNHLKWGFAMKPIASYEEIVQEIFRDSLLTFTDSIVSFPYLTDAIEDPKAKVLCTKDGEPQSIRIGRKNETRWIVRISTWGLDLSRDSLDLLRRFYDYMEVGTYATPGGVGWALMRKIWGEQHLPFHSIQNGYCDQFLWDYAPGGRCDTPGEGQLFARTLEFDMRSGYLAYYTLHPTGKAGYFKYGLCNSYATYFARVSATIHASALPTLGPFHVRDETGLLRYPIEPGTYETYLWKEQVEACQNVGVDVVVEDGYGWQTMTTDNVPWTKLMYLKTQRAEDDIRPLVKLCYVAAIGRHRMQHDFFILVPESQYYKGDLAVAEGSKFYAYFIHRERDFSSVNMPHWWAYTIARTNLALWEFAYPYASDGRLLATNFDSVMVLPHEQDYHRFPSREESQKDPAGSWGWTELTNVHITAPRSFISDQKTVQPGIERKSRQ